MRLFQIPGSRSDRIRWLCEELNLPLELVTVDIHDLPDELVAINPCRTVPVFVDGEHVMTESVGAMLYIASRHSPRCLAVAPEETGYAEFLQYLELGEAGMLSPLNAIISSKFFGPEGSLDNYTAQAIIKSLGGRIEQLRRRLESVEYLAADRFTIADISVAFAVKVAVKMLGLGEHYPPEVVNYAERMMARPSYQVISKR